VPRLSDIRGQDRAIARLRSAIASGRLHHAYLFTGPPASGKRTTAIALASALNCVRSPGEGCADTEEACDPCAKIAHGIHPDIVTLEREGAAMIVPIESIRQNVIARVGLPPHEAKVRVFLLDEATALQPAAANSLLKTLEEPPARTMFVLGTVAPDQLLPTIRSRCQRVSFSALAAEERARATNDASEAARLERVAELAGEIARFAGEGALGGAGLDRMVGVAARIAEEKGSAAEILDQAARKLHDAAIVAVRDGRAGAAKVMGERAKLVLDTQTAVTVHNTHVQIACEALLGRLWGLSA
jgi:DNA polymerase III subunit delta'